MPASLLEYRGVPDRPQEQHYRPDLDTNMNGYLLYPGEILVRHASVEVSPIEPGIRPKNA